MTENQELAMKAKIRIACHAATCSDDFGLIDLLLANTPAANQKAFFESAKNMGLLK